MQMDPAALTRPLPRFHGKAINIGLARFLTRTPGRLILRT